MRSRGPHDWVCLLRGCLPSRGLAVTILVIWALFVFTLFAPDYG